MMMAGEYGEMSESKPSDDASLFPKVLSKLRLSIGFRTSWGESPLVS